MQMNHGIGAQIDRAIDKNKTNMVVYHIFSFITPIFHKMQVTINVLQLKHVCSTKFSNIWNVACLGVRLFCIIFYYFLLYLKL
jgi:hypothetical protein